jgi:hypothetical protein
MTKCSRYIISITSHTCLSHLMLINRCIQLIIEIKLFDWFEKCISCRIDKTNPCQQVLALFKAVYFWLGLLHSIHLKYSDFTYDNVKRVWMALIKFSCCYQLKVVANWLLLTADKSVGTFLTLRAKLIVLVWINVNIT